MSGVDRPAGLRLCVTGDADGPLPADGLARLLQCFMNSILQCLSNTRELRDYCLQRLYARDLRPRSSAHSALMEGEGRPVPGGRRGLCAPAPLLLLGLLGAGVLASELLQELCPPSFTRSPLQSLQS